MRLNLSGVDSTEADADALHGTIFSYNRSNGTSAFTCRLFVEDLRRIYTHLGQYSIVTSASTERTGKFIELKPGLEELSQLLTRADVHSVVPVIKDLVANRFSKEDTSTILGRKDGLELFQAMLDKGDHSEPEWQKFFEVNDWIFGYGLRYQFLGILQREAHVSSTDLTGGESVISDFLLADAAFTKLVEIKRPDTPLFGSRRNRSDAWCLSTELMDAVSQILAQKANWDLEGTKTQFDKAGRRIEQGVADVDCILVIGDTNNADGTDQEKKIKAKTFELFRRNLRNVEILTYDELLDRAKYIVRGVATGG